MDVSPGEELGFSASLKPGVSPYVDVAGVGGAPFTPGASGLHTPSHSQSSVNFLAQPFRLLRLTRRNSFLAPESARLPHRKSRGVGECPASTRPGHAPSPPLRPYSPAACVVITWPGKVLTSRWEGVRRRRKGGGGTRLVVLLPESRILSSCGRAASSLPTMSHLVEPPPPLHNNNNNCEEGEQSLPPPAGLNSEHGAAGLSGGMGEEPLPPCGGGRKGGGSRRQPIGLGRGCGM